MLTLGEIAVENIHLFRTRGFFFNLYVLSELKLYKRASLNAKILKKKSTLNFFFSIFRYFNLIMATSIVEILRFNFYFCHNSSECIPSVYCLNMYCISLRRGFSNLA